MKIWVGVTDQDWFDRLRQLRPDEVNFWQPSGSREFRVLQPGELFLFKLHSPNNYIVGGGHFVRCSPLPASLAWEAFLAKNGVDSLEELRARIRRYRRNDDAVDPEIGCNILAEPFFLDRSAWVQVPASWSRNIVQDAYQRRCAVTGEKTLPVLEAAHIRPYAESGPHWVSNGLLLRSDLHKLFDLGYVTVTPELKLLVSRRLREEWQNGREYYLYHGQPLRFRPADLASRPAPEFLEWHNEKRFHE